MSAAFDGALDDYIQHLRVERGLSKHTVDGYARDLVRFGARLSDEQASLAEVDEARVASYLVTLSQEGLSARTQARALSAIRGFFRFLVQERRAERDPTELLEGPRLLQKLPDILNRDEVFAQASRRLEP
jgi:integrase/recombinase XerD